MNGFSHLLVEKHEAIVVLTINRPDKLNALNRQILGELHEAFGALGRLTGNEAPRAVVLTGTGKAFSAGVDIEEMSAMSTLEAKARADAGHALCALIEESRFPVIAAVNGFALGGGCELALTCDFIYASDRAKLGQPEVNLGVIPGFGGTQRLARRVGIARARELIYTGDLLPADKALAIGLVNEVVPHDELLPKVQSLAERIAQKGPAAVAQAKRVLLRGAAPDLPPASELEAQAFAMLFGTADQKEGMKAFLEKRKPVFQGE
jgi:enoyl-CoA hydratase